MSRRPKRYKNHLQADPRHNSIAVTKFINKVMIGGKKTTAERIVYDALEKLSKESGESELVSFEKAMKNVLPLMEVRSRRVGGSTYQVPMEVRTDRSMSLAMRWLVASARKRSGRSMIDKLAAELLDSYNNTGASVKKREDTHKMAEANKAFAHFRW